MNYKKIHDQIIDKAKLENRIKNNGIYYEKHHIIPKCMGGNNSKENIILLTAKEHYLIHFLLTNIYPSNKKLIYAFWMMCNGSKKNRPIPNQNIYQIARKLFSENRKGKPSGSKGYKHSDEAKLKNRIAHLGSIPSEEARKKMSIKSTGRKRSEDSKRRTAIARMKPVLQYDKNDNLIREWESGAAVYKELKITRIGDCLKNRRTICHGFKWKFKN